MNKPNSLDTENGIRALNTHGESSTNRCKLCSSSNRGCKNVSVFPYYPGRLVQNQNACRLMGSNSSPLHPHQQQSRDQFRLIVEGTTLSISMLPVQHQDACRRGHLQSRNFYLPFQFIVRTLPRCSNVRTAFTSVSTVENLKRSVSTKVNAALFPKPFI